MPSPLPPVMPLGRASHVSGSRRGARDQQKGTETMTSLRKTALVAGLLYLITYLAIPTVALYGPALDDPNFIASAGNSVNTSNWSEERIEGNGRTKWVDPFAVVMITFLVIK